MLTRCVRSVRQGPTTLVAMWSRAGAAGAVPISHPHQAQPALCSASAGQVRALITAARPLLVTNNIKFVRYRRSSVSLSDSAAPSSGPALRQFWGPLELAAANGWVRVSLSVQPRALQHAGRPAVHALQ